MGSTRLPGKVLRPLGHRPVLEWVVRAARRSAAIDEVIVATTNEPVDDAVVALADQLGVAVHRGPTDDVLTRVQGLRLVAEKVGLTMAQLAVAWVLQNDNVAAAIIGASRPEQVGENVKAAGVRLDADVMRAVDEALGDAVIRDPGQTAARAPKKRAV